MIQTVTGICKEKDIKNTLPHEHLVFGKPGMAGDGNNPYCRQAAVSHIRSMLEKVKPYEVNLIVDATTIEYGRDPVLMKEMSEESGIKIVCATGFFKDAGDMLAHLKALSYTCSLQDYLKKYFILEIVDGIGDCGIKAGALKAATSLGQIRPLEKVILMAAAEAQKETGVPLLTHCDGGTMGMEQAELLLSMNVLPSKIIIGHMSSNRNLQEIREIIKCGVFVAFDQFGILSIPGIPSDEEKAENLRILLEEGYEDSIVLSNDSCFDRMGYVSKSKPRYPDMVYRFVLPYLREKGIGEETIGKITRNNLMRAFR